MAKLLGTNVGIIFPELNSLLNDADIEVSKVFTLSHNFLISHEIEIYGRLASSSNG